MEYYLTENAISSTSRKVYALKGEKVKTIADHDNCLIVESDKGIRFGIQKIFLSEDFVPKEIIIDNVKTKRNGKK
jgi:hypothetical protein